VLPPTWDPADGVALLDFDFARHGATHDPSGKLQKPLRRALEVLGCLLGRIPPAYGGSQMKAVSLQIPKTGSRHLQTILDKEYGKPQFMTRCHPVPAIHLRPYLGEEVFGEDWAPDESCRKEAAAGAKWDEAVWEAQLVRGLVRRGVKLITVVREPVAHLLSLVSFRRGFDPESESALSELARFVARPVISANMQLGFLSRKRLQAAPCWLGHNPDVTAQDLEEVQRMLNGGSMLAGTSEQFDATVRMFAAELRWNRFDVDGYGSFEPRTEERIKGQEALAEPGKSKFRNGDMTSKKLRQEDLPPEILAAIRNISSLDRQLYDDVSERVRTYASRSLEL